MGMKTFLKRFVAAFGNAASEQLSNQPDPYLNLAASDPSKLDPMAVNCFDADLTTLPPGGLAEVVTDDD